jgi:hypothetical protein
MLSQRLARNSGDGQRHVDQAFLAAAGGDDDDAFFSFVADAGGVIDRVLRIGGGGEGGDSGATGKQQHAAGECLGHGVCSSPGPLLPP